MEVLIVEDDDTIAGPLQRGLEREGFVARRVASGAEALAAAPADVVLLDLGLPDLDGFEVCRRLRAASDVPIIVLTARGDEIDRVVGLELGADDYVTKPFSPREFGARVEALLRRPRAADDVPDERVVGSVVIRPRARSVEIDGVTVELTRIEFDLLDTFTANPKVVFTRPQLLERVWGPNWYGDDHVVDVHVANLRKKLSAAGGENPVRTVRGVGYGLAG